MESNTIKGSSKIVVSKEQVSCNMDEEVVILNIKEGEYFELNPVAARVWEIIQEPRAVNEIMDIIFEEYDVSKEELEKDLYELIHELYAKNLVDIG